jgi:hypothetical protein
MLFGIYPKQQQQQLMNNFINKNIDVEKNF